ncbi:MAG: LON peptidase substrate-binding domain-containing protein [Nitriliruptoraceae bacterium]
MRELPMFPLGTVLFPHMVLPLHVFEPRYRTLLEHIMAPGSAREFGVVLIARGGEVGGGDLRTDVGTVARVIRSEELDGSRALVIALGTRRLHVERWLADDPYPRAEVTERADTHDDQAVIDASSVTIPRLRRVLALQAERGRGDVAPTFDLADEPDVACWQAAVLSPLNPHDAQRVLQTDDCADRLRLLDELLAGIEETLELERDLDGP